jgi:hypothetical protein
VVDFQSQNQLGEGSIALAKNLNINGNAKTSVSNEQIVLCVSLPGRSEIAISNHSLGRWGSFNSFGRIVENEVGVAGVGMEPF